MSSVVLSDWLIVIPARLKSQRLANKPLEDLCGKALIQRVYENLLPLTVDGAKIIVAVDSKEVEALCLHNGIPCMMTKESHPSGTDRCHEVSVRNPSRFVLNVQGDEPFINLHDLKALMSAMSKSNSPMGTMTIRAFGRDHFSNPNIVKIVRSRDGRALYFSRAPVPYDRDRMLGKNPSPFDENVFGFWQHLGVYAFTQEGLRDFCVLPKSELEDLEKLEQLRAIDAGWNILVSEAKHPSIGIDTPEDLAAATIRMQNKSSAKKA